MSDSISYRRAQLPAVMSVVLARAAEQNIKIEPRDSRTLYLDDRPCQVIKSKWYEDVRHYQSLPMYMPRSNFADFLLYVPDGFDTVYVVPRGKIAHDTSWAESALEPYKEAWPLLKETNSFMLERKTKSLSNQIKKIVAEAEKHGLSFRLIRSKRSQSRTDYRTYLQRRILIEGKRCAVFTASLLPESTHMWPAAHFRAPKDDWAEILLYILGDDVYVVPRSNMPHETTLALQSDRIYDYKNSWCVLKGVDPTCSKAE